MDVNGGESSHQNNKSSAKASITNKTKLLKSLDWDDYLPCCGGEPAPAEYFNQNIDPPVNEFMINQKLEVTSPDNRDFIHLATVVGYMGPRLQLRLDGCDSSNDFFELVDSDVINPIGTHLVKNRYFAAPLRFRKDAAAYNSFCKQILKNAAHAPQTCFKEKPIRPSKNRFQPGMKLEAVDIKHPSNICPATIKMVDKHNVEIHLDGWDSTNDYKCPYFSRNLFPVGWCKKTGHILQFPGPRAEYQEKVNQLDGSISVKNQPCPSHNQQNTITNHHLHHDSIDDTSEKPNREKTKTTEAAIIKDEEIGNIKSSPVLPSQPLIHQMKQNEAASSTKNQEIKFEANDVANNKNENNNHDINDTSTGSDSLIKPIMMKSDQKSDNENHSLNSSVFSADGRINNSKKRNFDQTEPEKQFSKSLINGKKSSIINEQYESVLPSKHLVNQWSVEELIEFLNHKLPEFHKVEQNFRSQEIDGNAFLMLTNDLTMKFLNIKLGYSLKIIDLIDRINSQTC